MKLGPGGQLDLTTPPKLTRNHRAQGDWLYRTMHWSVVDTVNLRATSKLLVKFSRSPEIAQICTQCYQFAIWGSTMHLHESMKRLIFPLIGKKNPEEARSNENFPHTWTIWLESTLAYVVASQSQISWWWLWRGPLHTQESEWNWIWNVKNPSHFGHSEYRRCAS